MSFVSVAAQMAIQAAIQAAMGKSKDEIGRSAAKTAMSGAIGGALGGGLGGGMVGEGLGGAVGGAATAAAFGEDVGQGALSGGIAGGARGYAQGAGGGSAPESQQIGGADWSLSNAVNNFGTNFQNSLPMGLTGEPTDYAGAMDRWKFGIGEGKTIVPNISVGAQKDVIANPNIIGPDLTNSEAGTQFAEQFAKNNTAVDPGKSFKSGMDLIDKNPGWSMLGAGALGGIGGYMLSSGGSDDQNNNQNDNQQQEYTWPEMSPNYQPTINIPRDTVKYYYANGGITGIGQPNLTAQPPETPEAPPVNKFYADALAQAQQAVAQQAPEEAPVEEAPAAVTEPVQQAAKGGIMGDSSLGGYAHGGIPRLTRGPGDGVSDSIPAEIGDTGKQPARLADGEFVIPARIVSELGNGSTEAGARALQAMVDRVQARRKKSIGKGKVAVDSKARKGLPA
jgi:hypothetical protein